MPLYIADQLLDLDRARRAALARMDYQEARSIRLSIAIIIGLSEWREKSGRG